MCGKQEKGFCELVMTEASWGVKRRVVLSKVEGKQSPKNNWNAKEINCHELYGNPGEIASPPAGGSQNPYTYYALTVCMNF